MKLFFIFFKLRFSQFSSFRFHMNATNKNHSSATMRNYSPVRFKHNYTNIRSNIMLEYVGSIFWDFYHIGIRKQVVKCGEFRLVWFSIFLILLAAGMKLATLWFVIRHLFDTFSSVADVESRTRNLPYCIGVRTLCTGVTHYLVMRKISYYAL